jgi:phosphohistidine phosphatase SixA
MRSVRIPAALLALFLVFAAPAAAQQTVFLVRHAERADGGQAGAAAMVTPQTDPPLSAAGHERAARLAAILRSADIKQVWTTEFLRTKQTAAPTAEALKLQLGPVSARDVDGLILRVTAAKANVLVVHSNTVPDILKRLGIKETITIADTEYDNLFIVVRPAAGDPTLIRMRF